MAFTILANSTTADATEVMGNFYFVGAGDRLPYFQNTAGSLVGVDNTYDLGSDTVAWRRLYSKQIGDAAFDYAIKGASVTAEITELQLTATAVVVNSGCSVTFNTPPYIPAGQTFVSGPTIKTAYISIGAWAFSGTDVVWVDVSSYLNTTTVYPMDIRVMIFADEALRTAAAAPSMGGADIFQMDVMAADNTESIFNTHFGVCYWKYANVPTVPAIRLMRYMINWLSLSSYYDDLTINRGFVRLEYMET